MNEERPENTEKDQLQKVMAGSGALSSPLFWGVLIFVPIAITLFMSVNKAKKQENVVQAVIEKPVEGPVQLQVPLRSGRKR